MQTVEAGGQTPVHYHDCEKAIGIIEGAEQPSIEEKISEFGPGHILFIPLFPLTR